MQAMTSAPARTDEARPPVTARLRGGGLALAALSGATVAIQSRINGELGARLHDGIAAAAISFGTGMLALLAMVPATRRGRLGLAAIRAALSRGDLRGWHCLGGVSGAYFVVTQGTTVAVLGVAVFTVALVAGQSASALLVDRLGIGPTGRHAVTTPRVAGAVLAVIAVGVSVAGRLTTPHALGLAALPALAGFGVAWQQAVNGRVREAAGTPLPAAFVNFATGTAALGVAYAVEVALRGLPSGRLPPEPWLYLGGPLGVLFIAVAASVVRLTGVLLMGLAMIAGQLLAALALELTVPGTAGHTGMYTVGGVAITLLAVGIAALGPRRSPGDRHTAPVGVTEQGD
jgi:transporter family-2 protein